MKCSFMMSLVVLALNCPAQWSSNTTVNTPVAIITKSQQKIHVCGDAANGAVITWEDNRNSSSTSSDIYAQRMNVQGYAKWSANGIAVCTNTAAQKAPAITEAGNGDVIITWEDNRSGNYDIYAQKIDSAGNVLWGADGVVVCNKTTNQKGPKIIGDNAGGAIIVWEDSLNFYYDIYAQRINSSGAAVWAVNGVAVCTAQNTQNNPRIDFGIAGGAIITWQDKRNNSDYDIYAQSLDASGSPQWAANGAVICNAVNTQSNPKIEPDGTNGALFTWEDKRNSVDYDIYAQRVNSSGIVQWQTNGVNVVNATFNQSAPEMKYLGGTICISWKDVRSGSFAVYAQLLNLSGVPLLAANGIQLSSALKSINPNNIPDGNGGVIVAWQDSTASGWNISAQKINSAGLTQWPAGGVVVSDAVNNQINVVQVSDGAGGAIFAWEDYRNGTDYDLFAQRIYTDGATILSIKEKGKMSSLTVSCYPNPATKNTIIKINEDTKDWTVSIYDIKGTLMESQSLKGNESFHLSSAFYPNGVYFYSVSSSDFSSAVHGKLIITDHE